MADATPQVQVNIDNPQTELDKVVKQIVDELTKRIITQVQSEINKVQPGPGSNPNTPTPTPATPTGTTGHVPDIVHLAHFVRILAVNLHNVMMSMGMPPNKDVNGIKDSLK